MSCKYMIYHKEEKHYPRLYCNIDDTQCIYSKRCEKVEKFIPNGELWKECYKFVEEQRKSIPNGSNYIITSRPSKNGNLFLYVVIDNNVEKIKTDLKEINQNYIYVNKTQDTYAISLTPFVEEKKTNRKKNNRKNG